MIKAINIHVYAKISKTYNLSLLYPDCFTNHTLKGFTANKKRTIPHKNDKFKPQNKLHILNEEYKMLINQKIKELASCNNSMQREIIENTYKELEKEKMQSIAYLQGLIQSDEKKNLEEKNH